MANDLIKRGFEDQRNLGTIRPSSVPIVRLPSTVRDPLFDSAPSDPSKLQVIQEGNMSFTGSDFDVQIHFPQATIITETARTQAKSAQASDERYIFPDGAPRVYNLIGLTSLSVNTFREQVAVRPLGYTSPRGFGPGPRTVAGTLVITILQFSPLKQITVFDPTNRSIGEFNLVSDSLPPFNLIITGMNEYGQTSMMIVYGVKIATTGQTISVYDRLTEEAYEFVAQDTMPLTPMPNIKGLVDKEREKLARAIEEKYGFTDDASLKLDVTSHGHGVQFNIADMLDKIAAENNKVNIETKTSSNIGLGNPQRLPAPRSSTITPLGQ